PAHSRYRKIVLTSRILSLAPILWARPPRRVAEQSHLLFPIQLLPILHHHFFPIFFLLIPSCLNKLSVLPVGYFVPVDPERSQVNRPHLLISRYGQLAQVFLGRRH